MRLIFAPIVLLLAVVTVSGCTSTSSGESSPDAPVTQQAPGEAGPEIARDTASGEALDVSGAGAELDRAIVTSGDMTVTADDPIAAAGEAAAIAESAGGRVDARTENAPVGNDSGSATLELRLPAATLTSTLDELKSLGEVEHVALAATDVTTESRDL
ncbi:MAG: hypothetical protein JWM51_349, partial [Microbacteriaceae bacterium]|nr:hypothetical protein [Microbacteriaceae bacterium]